MRAIDGCDLAKAAADANAGLAKLAQARLVDVLRGKKAQAHNLRMKQHRLEDEARLAGKMAEEVEAAVARIETGDWGAVEPFDLDEKK